ncbi:nuclear transport factor 2 family protein [Hyphococcus luteus]|uniref:Steroid delta-isomerase n=1 Tax=Hyphococcus luteus TaxID=2058213 RepID=A0A2S7JZ13_9PROT|nr:nuclear transport factor 2 family protein [Marinicaulis flavus]PQA85491.1 steroid delta-isomerase [Marinicaulis flavus]
MEGPKDVIKGWVDAFNSGEADRIAEFYVDDAVNHQVTQDPVVGKEAIREMFAAEFASADMTCLIENIFEDGEWVALEWKDPNGLRGCGFFHVKNGKIAFQRGYWDKLSFLRLHNLPIE